jgi:hypothetical protein
MPVVPDSVTRTTIQHLRDERDLHHSGNPNPAYPSERGWQQPRRAGAPSEASMNKQNSMIHPAANEQSEPIELSELSELSEQQLDNVTGGTKASLNLSSHCCTGKHIPTAVIAMRG